MDAAWRAWRSCWRSGRTEATKNLPSTRFERVSSVIGAAPSQTTVASYRSTFERYLSRIPAAERRLNLPLLFSFSVGLQRYSHCIQSIYLYVTTSLRWFMSPFGDQGGGIKFLASHVLSTILPPLYQRMYLLLHLSFPTYFYVLVARVARAYTARKGWS